MFIQGYICVCVCVCVYPYIYRYLERVISKYVLLFSSSSDSLQSLFLPHAGNISCYTVVRAQRHSENHQNSAKLRLLQWVHVITSVSLISSYISNRAGHEKLLSFSAVTDCFCVSLKKKTNPKKPPNLPKTTKRLEFTGTSVCVRISR